MFKNRVINILIVAAFVAVMALTIQQARETTKVVQAAEAAGAPVCAVPAVNVNSIHTEYVEEADMWLPHSDNGPTGVDGGLIELLSGARRCSQ